MNQQHRLLQAGFEFDIFLDLSRTGVDSESLSEYVRRLKAEPGVIPEGARVFIAIPEGNKPRTERVYGTYESEGDPVDLLRAAIADAASKRRGLAIITGAWRPNNESLCSLAETGSCDPMIASVQPRFSVADGSAVVSLPPDPKPLLPLIALRYMPGIVVTPELPSALLLLTPRGVLAAPEIVAVSLEGGLMDLLVGLRRRGFRNLVCNRIVVPFPLDSSLAYPEPVADGVAGDGLGWQRDAARGRRWLEVLPERRLEALLSGGFSRDGRPRLLLDCRGVSDCHNGSARAVLGLLGGFARLKSIGFAPVVLISAATANFHDVTRRYPCFEYELDYPQGFFFAAVLLNQPLSFSTITELHHHAAIILFNILDTFAWDAIYPAPDDLDKTWRAVAQLADGLLFNSHFSLEHFKFRFAPNPEIPLIVTHHGVRREEVIPNGVSPTAVNEPSLLVFGSEYDHQDVNDVLSKLVDAFPFTKIVAIGTASHASPRVVLIKSGSIDIRKIYSLMADASAIIFPSHNEGTGLPIIEGLARGKTVIVRDLAMWHEIARLSQNPQLIVPFQDELELVEAVGRVLHGLPSMGLQHLGESYGTEPTWGECAQKILDLLAHLASKFDGRRWLARNDFFPMSGEELNHTSFEDELKQIRGSVFYGPLRGCIKIERALRRFAQHVLGTFQKRSYGPRPHIEAAAANPKQICNVPISSRPVTLQVHRTGNATARTTRVQLSAAPLVICISHVAPWPPRAGNEYRIQRMMNWLCGAGFDVLLLLCPLPGQELNAQQMAELTLICPNVIVVNRNGSLYFQAARKVVEACVKSLDGRITRDFASILGESDCNHAAARLDSIIQIFSPDALVETLLALEEGLKPRVVLANYVLMTRGLPLLQSTALKIVDTHDVFSTKASKVVAYGIEDKLVMSQEEEAALLARADVVLAIQCEEANELRRIIPAAKIVTVGVDMPEPPLSDGPASGKIVLLVASGNPMNVKGLRDFLRFSWLRVIEAHPDAELHVVGAVGDVLSGNEYNVRRLGCLDNIADVYGQARLVINPAVAGTGLKIKTIEALAHLKPIVLWPSGLDGIPSELRALCDCVTDWFMFTNSVIRLLGDEDKQKRMNEARHKIARMLSTKTVYAELERVLRPIERTPNHPKDHPIQTGVLT